MNEKTIDDLIRKAMDERTRSGDRRECFKLLLNHYSNEASMSPRPTVKHSLTVQKNPR